MHTNATHAMYTNAILALVFYFEDLKVNRGSAEGFLYSWVFHRALWKHARVKVQS